MSRTPRYARVFAWSMVLMILAIPVMAQQPGEPAAPSFRDERRWAPRKAPAVAPDTRTPDAAKGPSTPAAVAPQGPAAKAQPTPAVPPVATPAVPVAPMPPVQRTSVAPPVNPSVKRLAPGACGVPEVKTAPLPAGRMQLVLTSGCRANQEIGLSYGGAEITAKLDGVGRVDLTIDCFAGMTTPVDIKLTDGTELSLPVTATDLDRVSKVAVIWRANVDLDLHAFEHAAVPGEPGHVWSGAARTLESVRERVEKGPRGAGFLSAVAKADGMRDRIEIYTFLHRDGHAAGVIALSVDHATRGSRPTAETCGSGPLAEVPFRIVTLNRRGQVHRMSGLIASAPCDATFDPAARYNTNLLPPLRLRP